MNDIGGLLVKRGNYYSAVSWFKKAAAMGDEQAKANLKKCHRLLKSKHKMILREDYRHSASRGNAFIDSPAYWIITELFEYSEPANARLVMGTAA